jgi:gag-polypeptide of LTR copia-type/Domain of unknown function (DUF4219)
MSEFKSSFVDKLNHDNYSTWKIQMRAFLQEKKLWYVIDKELAADAIEQVKIKYAEDDQSARNWITLLVQTNQLLLIKKCDTAQSVWNTLHSFYTSNTVTSKVRCLKALFKRQMPARGNLKEFLSETFLKLDELAEMGVELNDEISVAILLASLNDEYDNLVTAIEAWDASKLKVANVRQKLLDEYEKKKIQYSSEQSFQVNPVQRNYRPYSTNINKPNQAYNNYVALDRPAYPSQSQCGYCKLFGHIKVYCKKKAFVDSQRAPSSHQAHSSHQANQGYAPQQYYQTPAQYQVPANQVQQGSDDPNNQVNQVQQSALSMNEEVWILDSGASAHLCKNLSLLNNLDGNDVRTFTVASGAKLKTIGSGNVEQTCPNRCF